MTESLSRVVDREPPEASRIAVIGGESAASTISEMISDEISRLPRRDALPPG